MATWNVRVNAGEHARMECPVAVDIGNVDGRKPASLRMTETTTGRLVPCQGGMDAQGNLMVHWVIDSLAAGENRSYVVETSDEPLAGHGVALKNEGGKVDVSIGAHLFTSYNYDAKWARPFLWPFVGPYGDSVTRNYPMVPNIEGENHDHHHHKSVYTAFGEVNGVDDWSEEAGHGRIVHKGFKQLVSGPVLGVIQTDNDWVSRDGEPVLYEQRTIVVHNILPSHEKLVDFTIHFMANRGQPVKFGDTKEGGILSVRVATSMDVASGLGGKIENSFGGINEDETWGKPAHWCDYSGPVKGRQVGITVMDHPNNLRHPTGWHVRNYGLMTANCFAESFYKNDQTLDGSYTIPAGGELVFRYRLLVHRGDAAAGRVAARYHDYINPPQVQVV
ncbi:MAG: DUF6807 domain-containing protein [Anaerolineae bacterium]